VIANNAMKIEKLKEYSVEEVMAQGYYLYVDADDNENDESFKKTCSKTYYHQHSIIT